MKSEYLNNNESNSEEERNAPQLSKMGKANPFNVPDGYFDSLPGNIMKKIDALPDVERMSRENPFNVPEGYFDSLPAAIQQKIIDDRKGKRFSAEWIFALLRPKYLAAAMLVVFIIFGIKYLTRPVILSPSSEYLSYEEVQSSSCISDIDESDFVDVLEQEQNSNSTVNEDTGIEQYLLDNNIDISQIENHL